MIATSEMRLATNPRANNRFNLSRLSSSFLKIVNLLSKFLLPVFLLLNFAMPLPASAISGSLVRTPHVTAQFLTGESTWSQGTVHSLALYFDIIDGWHVYWKNPGDSGIVTSVQWQLPPGVQITRVDWPYPERIEVGPITNFGYHESTAILFEVDHANFAEADSDLKIRADVNWLVCEESCIPERGSFTIDIPMAGAPIRHEKESSIIDYFRSRIPSPLAEFESNALAKDEWIKLSIQSGVVPKDTTKIDFFPEDEFLLQHNNRPLIDEQSDGSVDIYLSRNRSFSEKLPSHLVGVLVLTGDPTTARAVRAPLSVSTNFSVPSSSAVKKSSSATSDAHSSALTSAPAETALQTISLWQAILFAFLGGVLLNLMPCVFPVLAIKVLGFVQHAGSAHARWHGFLYSAGVVISFLFLGGLLLALRAGGLQLGWGFHLQSPEFLAVLITLLFALSLNLFGYFEFSGRFMGLGQRLTEGNSSSASFFTGVLAVVVATPCSAPFMGSAIGASLTLPAVYTFVIFTALGVGLAAPYLLLSTSPRLASWLPKPGPWMQTLREALGFPMVLTAIWLLWVLNQQVGPNGLAVELLSLTCLVFAFWFPRKIPEAFRAPATALLVLLSAAIGILGVNAIKSTHSNAAGNPNAGKFAFATDLIPWETYSEENIQQHLAQGKIVFVNFTAAWCLTCKVNERVAFSSAEVRELFHSKKAIGLIADWTNQDPEITKALSRQNRLGVPLYLVYKPGVESPQVLPQVLTPQILLDALE